ncbi:MAG TPA: S-layer homology domain-containing protein [Thermoanaerobaculia bacterium]|nr:S-layer homology domain-containing protein [Thermoanaerobaculia bacterium]
MFLKRSLRVLLTAVCALSASRVSRGQAPTVPPPHDYGTMRPAPVAVPAIAFTSLTYTTPFGTTTTTQILRTAAGGNPFDVSSFAAPLKLPAGALISSLEMNACDNSGGLEPVSGYLVVTDNMGTVITTTDTLTTPGTGCGNEVENLVPKNIVVNPFYNYYLRCDITSTATYTVGLAGMVLEYKLQVSPAPATATFADVPTNFTYFRTIEALAASGITSGCGGGNFCPNQYVTRGEMSKFLANALGLFWGGD